MIPIQLWRARIGLFNAKRHCGPRSSFSSGSPAKGSPLGSSSLVLLLEKSSMPPMAHSPIRDLPPGSGPSIDHECALSTESDSLISSSTVSISHDMYEQSAVTNNKYSARLSSETVHSLLSSMTADRLYLPDDLLKDTLVMLLIVIISQLLVLSGDVETNPGPITYDKPTMTQLISLKKTDGSGEYLRVIRWIASLSRSECVDFAHLLLVDPVKVRTHQKISNSDEFVRAVLYDWLCSRDDSRAVPCTWKALADCMEAAGLPGDLVISIRETRPSGSPQVQIEDEDVGMPPAKKPRVSLHSVQVLVKPDIPKELLALMEEYSDMLVVLQTARLSKERLSRLKLFLAGYCDEKSFKNCPSPEEIVEQLRLKLKIHIFNIDTLTACCKYFRNDEVSRYIQQYKGHLKTFLSTTSVKELQSSLQTNEITCLDDTEPLTLKLDETASNDTLMNLKKLVYHLFGHSSKALIIRNIHSGCVCVTWIVPASLVSTLRAKAEQLSPENLASRGVLELVIGLRIVPNEDATSKAQVADAAILQSDKSSSSDSQMIAEQQRMFATILKRNESEFEAEKKEKLWFEEKCDKLELEMKKVANEKFDCEEKSNMLQKEVKSLQEQLAAASKTDRVLPMKVQFESHRSHSKDSTDDGAAMKCLCQVFYHRQGFNRWRTTLAFCTRDYIDNMKVFYQDATIGPCVDVQFIATPIKVSSDEVMTEGWEVICDWQHTEVTRAAVEQYSGYGYPPYCEMTLRATTDGDSTPPDLTLPVTLTGARQPTTIILERVAERPAGIKSKQETGSLRGVDVHGETVLEVVGDKPQKLEWHSQYGAVKLEQFSLIGETASDDTDTKCTALMFYKEQTLSPLSPLVVEFHFVVVKCLEPNLQRVMTEYQGWINDKSTSFTFCLSSNTTIQLDLEEQEIDPWRILPLVSPPKVSSDDVSNFEAGQRIPHCSYEFQLLPGKPFQRLLHKVALIGVSSPNSFHIRYPQPEENRLHHSSTSTSPPASPRDESELSNSLDITHVRQVRQAVRNVSDWQSLGIELGLLYPTLESIETDKQTVSECRLAMIAAWLKQQDDVSKNGTPSWSVLQAALREIGENKIADHIANRSQFPYSP